MTRRLVYVVGTPSGGTSAVAGILHHLGVNMGDFLDAPGIRGYRMFEDRNLDEFKITPEGESPRILRQRFRFKEYVTHRLKGDRGRVGFKGSSLYWLGISGFEKLPVEAVIVDRSLEDAIDSDRRIVERIPKSRPDVDPPTDQELIQRAAGIAGAWRAKELLAERHPKMVTARLPFEWVLKEPVLAVGMLANRLDLLREGALPAERLTAAVRFIEKGTAKRRKAR